MKRDPYAEVSTRIVAELEAGAAPWVNAVSNRPYSGCNVVLLWMAQAVGYRTPRFLTAAEMPPSSNRLWSWATTCAKVSTARRSIS
jgi:antirestriction protein ArdC